jgi:hypothetical protein
LLPALPVLAAGPAFVLPRASELLSELFSEFWLNCRNPPFELAFEPAREPAFDPPLPGRAASRPLPADLPASDAELLRPEKKCWFSETFRVVDGAAARPLAE